MTNPAAVSQAEYPEINPIHTFSSLEESDLTGQELRAWNIREGEKVRICEYLNINGYYIEMRGQITYN